MFAPPYISLGGGRLLPSSPRSTPLGASDLDEQGGMCTVADPGFAKKGWAEKSVRLAHRARVSARLIRWGPGARRRAPGGGCRAKAPAGGPGGGAPRKLSSFQQIRAFKMVVRSDRKV